MSWEDWEGSFSRGSPSSGSRAGGTFTQAKVERRRAQIEESVARYLQQLDTADRQEPSDALAARTTRLKEKIARLGQEMQRLADLEA
jgi:transposase